MQNSHQSGSKQWNEHSLFCFVVTFLFVLVRIVHPIFWNLNAQKTAFKLKSNVLSHTKTKHHPTRTFPNQFPKRRYFATELHGKFLQRILCRTKNGEIVHLLRRKNVPWCAEAKRLQFLFLRFVCCWQTENMENSVSCVGYVNIYDYGLVLEKPSLINVPRSEVPKFHGKPALFLSARKKKNQPQTEGICFWTKLLCDVYHPLKQSNVLHRKFDKNNPRVQVRPRTFQELAPRFCNENTYFLCSKTKHGGSLDHHDAQYVYMYNVYTEKLSIEYRI